jgi:hypothetical protein
MFDFIVFNTTRSALSITGAPIIISSAIYTSVLSSTFFRLDICSYAPADKKDRYQIRRCAHPRAASVATTRIRRHDGPMWRPLICRPDDVVMYLHRRMWLEYTLHGGNRLLQLPRNVAERQVFSGNWFN